MRYRSMFLSGVRIIGNFYSVKRSIEVNHQSLMLRYNPVNRLAVISWVDDSVSKYNTCKQMYT